MKKFKFFIFSFIMVTALTLASTPVLAQDNMMNEMMKYRNRSMEHQKNQDALCIVKKGDCLWKIAKRYNFKLEHIINSNPHFEDPNLIYPGDKVYKPNKNDMNNKDQMQQPEQRKQEPQQPNEQEDATTQRNNQMETMKKQVVNLVNQEREKRGLQPYQHNTKVANVAQKKAEDMRDNNYFSHRSPTYGSPFEMLNQFGVDYSAAGENIAKGQRTAQEVMNSWMNSPGHRKNILSSKYTHIGVGLTQDEQGRTYWVQMFIKP